MKFKMDFPQLLRFLSRRLLTERSVASLVIASVLLVAMNPLQWENNNVNRSRKRIKTSRTFREDVGGDESKTRIGFVDILPWRRSVRRFALFANGTEPIASGAYHASPHLLPSRTDYLEMDSRMVLSHGNDSGCYFAERLDLWGLPLVHSIFADQVDRRVIITGVRRPTKDYSWHLEKFRCEFYHPGVIPQEETELEGNFSGLISVPTDPMIKDQQKVGAQPQGVFIMTCRLPKQLYGANVFKFNLRRLADGQDLAYANITVCRALPEKYSTHFLSICTMLKNMDKYVSDWLDYHKHLGVERAYIYDNAQYSTLITAPGVRRHVESGFLTIIPWSHAYSENKTYLETQIASENDCLWRHRHDATWMIKTDVDEFIQPMNPDMPTSLPAYLEQPFLKTLAGVRVQNWFFCRYDKKLSRRARMKEGGHGGTVFERNQYAARQPTIINKGRDKSIVRPDRVHYFKIHAIKWGGDILSFDPHTELRMVHYRGDNPRHPSFCPHVVNKDTSMFELWQRLTNTSEMH